jgi:hypothetical protein
MSNDDALFDYSELNKDDLILECNRLWKLNGEFLEGLNHQRRETHRLCEELLDRGKKLNALEAASEQPVELSAIEKMVQGYIDNIKSEPVYHRAPDPRHESREYAEVPAWALKRIAAYLRSTRERESISRKLLEELLGEMSLHYGDGDSQPKIMATVYEHLYGEDKEQ